MPSDALSTWKARLHEGLRSLEQRSQRRNLAEIRGVNLCSNDYLGLAENPTLRERVAEFIRGTGKIGGTGSRLLSGQTEEWRELEEKFAKFAGTESALYFTTGYAANLGLLAALAGKDDVIFCDALNHASLIDGMRLSGARKVIYPHLDLNALEDALRKEASTVQRKLIVTETVFSMDGDIAPLPEIAELAEKYDAVLIVDEAHATAVHGPGGRGLAVAAGLDAARAGDCAYLREGAGIGGSVCLRPRGVERAPGESRANFYFFHGIAAIHRGADWGGNAAFRGHGPRKGRVAEARRNVPRSLAGRGFRHSGQQQPDCSCGAGIE